MASDLIEVQALLVRRGSFTLDIPRWSVAAGDVVGVLGPNGAGKTTLLEAVAGLRPANAGAVRVFGLDPWGEPVKVRTRLGFMSDDMALFEMRVGALLRMLSGYYPTWDAQLGETLLSRFALDPRKKVGELSRGQGTRLRLVTALAFRPSVIVLDEPAAGLDLAGRRTLIESVLEVVRDENRSVVISSHLVQDIERITDRILVLQRGRVVRDGPIHELVAEGSTLEEAIGAWGAT